MQVVESRAEVRSWVDNARSEGHRIGLVPTMGYLHAGHASLIDVARSVSDQVALTIFVNPLQFGPTEDFARYPRDRERDLELARKAGVGLVFIPTVQEMYPGGDPWISVVPERGANVLDGLSRPDHFKGVLTVVAKLFGIFTPDIAVFGRKDLQQLFLIRRMVLDLNMNLEIVAAPTIREEDGLAMSSRNRYLSPDDRRRAVALSQAMRACEELFDAGEREATVYRDRLGQAGGNGVSVEYADVVDPDTLQSVERVGPGVVCAIAARVGSTRLIDNTILGTPLVFPGQAGTRESKTLGGT